MKFKFLLSGIVMAMCMGFSAQAAVGDVVGSIYTTDIGAFVDDMPIASYNIGGKTAIVVENLRDYGFIVEWKEQERLLVARAGYLPESMPSYIHKAEIPGNIAGKIYETNIKVLLNGLEVPSFNIGGLTAVTIEDIGNMPDGSFSHDGNAHRGMDRPYTNLGMYHIWNPDAKTISLYTLRPGSTIETDYGEVTIGASDGGVRRATYIKGAKSLSGMDGRCYTTYADTLEVDGRLYMMLYNIMGIFGGRVESAGDILNIRTNIESTIKLRFEDSLGAQVCQNILYPLTAKLSINDSILNSGYTDFYLYKNEIYVSVESLNMAAGKALLKDINSLPEESMQVRGKILYSKHIIYINGRAVDSYLASDGEYYIPVDRLSDIKFDILSSLEMRNLKSPEELPEIVTEAYNYPESYYLSDSEGKGYICEYYDGLHSVKIDDKPISSIYMHFPNTYLTPCIALSELVEAAGYNIEKNGDTIRVYTRADRLTIGIDEPFTSIVVYKNNAPAGSFPISEYQNVGVFGDYIYLEASGDRQGINEIYSTENFEKVTEVNGTIQAIKNDRIFAYENTSVDGEWARRQFIYDMTGNLIETYLDD